MLDHVLTCSPPDCKDARSFSGDDSASLTGPEVSGPWIGKGEDCWISVGSHFLPELILMLCSPSQEIAAVMEGLAYDSRVTDALLNYPFHYHNALACTSPSLSPVFPPAPSDPPRNHSRCLTRLLPPRSHLFRLLHLAHRPSRPDRRTARFHFCRVGHFAGVSPTRHGGGNSSSGGRERGRGMEEDQFEVGEVDSFGSGLSDE